MRLAFLIIAHDEFEVLRRLVALLDNEECDIYIHIDKKAKQLPIIETRRSQIHIIDDRLDVRWGHISQIRCEYLLWETAILNGPYDNYVFLSGTHLPLKKIQEIKSFYYQFAGKSILPGFERAGGYQKTLKMNRYNLFIRGANYGPPMKRHFCQFFWKICIKIQCILNIQNNRDYSFCVSSNWVALSQEAVSQMLSLKKTVLRKYKYTFCGDEWFVATELAHSPLSSTIVNPPLYLYCEWEKANPKTYPISEYNALCETGYLFARKFKSE